jgi:hypothetical protein
MDTTPTHKLKSMIWILFIGHYLRITRYDSLIWELSTTLKK